MHEVWGQSHGIPAWFGLEVALKLISLQSWDVTH